MEELHELLKFNGFVVSVINGDADTLRGIYVPDAFAWPVVQQTKGASEVVLGDVVTQFGWTYDKVIAVLGEAKENPGKSFMMLDVGSTVTLVYGDGRPVVYEITEVYSYQTDDATNPYASFGGMTTENVFDKFYRDPDGGEDKLILQSCKLTSWGSPLQRVFFVAQKKVSEEVQP
jgi:hypothetical protein